MKLFFLHFHEFKKKIANLTWFSLAKRKTFCSLKPFVYEHVQHKGSGIA